MAHFAKIENGIVVDVVVVADEHENDGQAYLNSLGLSGQWIQTSYNSKIRRKFAAIGDTYDPELDVFKPGKPSEDATWDEPNWGWKVTLKTLDPGTPGE